MQTGSQVQCFQKGTKGTPACSLCAGRMQMSKDGINMAMMPDQTFRTEG